MRVPCVKGPRKDYFFPHFLGIRAFAFKIELFWPEIPKLDRKCSRFEAEAQFTLFMCGFTHFPFLLSLGGGGVGVRSPTNKMGPLSDSFTFMFNLNILLFFKDKGHSRQWGQIIQRRIKLIWVPVTFPPSFNSQ